MDGIFNLNKPIGMTSHDVVARVRRLTHQRRVGHAGTLDPAASGVLPICLGQATRVVEYLSESGKRYRATIVLGAVTDTYDAEGEVIRSAPVHVTREEAQAALAAFLGPQMQLPPLYSAIKRAGQPLYKLARAGVEVQLEPRPVEIYTLDLIDWQPPTLTVDVECSKGTYIRSLAYDLGERLGCGGHLGGLVRLRSGPFTLDESLTLEELAQALEDGTWQNYLYAPDEALLDRLAVIVGPETEKRLLLGQDMAYPPPAEIYPSVPTERAEALLLPLSESKVEAAGAEEAQSDQADLPLLRAYSSDGRFLAILRWHAPARVWHPYKVLNVAPLEEQEQGR
jgi:tRNA pseudouridine55 synthase